MLCCGCFIERIFPLSCLNFGFSLLSCLVTSGYLAFLAVDWLRTVSASHHFSFHFTLIMLQFICPAHSLSSYLCWVVRPPPPSSLSSGPFPLLVLSSLIAYFAVGVSGFARSACPPVSFLAVWFGCFLFPRVRCLVFLAVDWSRISSAIPLLPL